MTPDEWLLAQHDARPRKAIGSVYVRPMIQLLDDHPLGDCVVTAGSCQNESGAASWPEPYPHHRLLPSGIE